jgi:hypothetical protein
MSEHSERVELAAGPHVLPLRDRTDELLQVLLPKFRLRKNDPAPGVRLSVEIKGPMSSIGDVHGKETLFEFVKKAGSKARDDLARRISDFYNDSGALEYSFDCSAHPLRYANGGVLPIVRLEGRDYFWLFYRDIFPIGWNIANGASDNVSEMLDPNRIILREFGEEVLFVDLGTQHLFTYEPEDGAMPLGSLKGAIAAWSKKLGADLFKFERLSIPLKWVDGPDVVEVDVEGRRCVTKGYFVSITPEDNAIEVDRIAFINLGKGVTLLDGEHRNGMLLNEVIGLFEVEKMRDLSRTEFIPDKVFFDGREWPCKENVAEGRREELAGAIGEYLTSPTLVRSAGLRRAYGEAPIKYDLCPITRSIVRKFFDWENVDTRQTPSDGIRVEPSQGEFELFISFRDPDLGIAQSVAADLHQRGFGVFMSAESLKSLGAADYFRAINEALEQSAVLVVVGTRPDRFDSGWVRYEWQSFLAEKHSGRKDFGRVFTFSGGVRIDELPYALRQVQMIPFDATSPESSFDTLASIIGPRARLREPRHESKP